MKSQYLSDAAERLDIPFDRPHQDNGNELWKKVYEPWGSGRFHFHLTGQGLSYLKQRIREERQAKRNVLLFWIKVVGGAVAAIAAVVALVRTL